jgi:hypothetical protein
MAVQHQKKRASMRSDQHKSTYKFGLLVALLGGVCLVIVAFVGGCTDKKSDVETAKPPDQSQTENSKTVSAQKQSDLLKLVGRWVRMDGGYIIEIRNVASDGKMDAAYFNPRPINVSVAEASRTSTGAKVFIELQDQGYPGSTYTLNYNPAEDSLVGFYYQAAMKQNFDVVFARVK